MSEDKGLKPLPPEVQEKANIMMATALIKGLLLKGMISQRTYDAIEKDSKKMIEKLDAR